MIDVQAPSGSLGGARDDRGAASGLTGCVGNQPRAEAAGSPIRPARASKRGSRRSLAGQGWSLNRHQIGAAIFNGALPPTNKRRIRIAYAGMRPQFE